MNNHSLTSNNNAPLAKTKLARMLLLLLVAYFILPTPITHAQKTGFFENWFPSLTVKNKTEEKKEDPAITLRAPFATDTTTPTKQRPNSNIPSWQEQNQVTSLAKVHINEKQAREWLELAISEAMSFPTNDYLRETQNNAKFFTELGWQDYQRFLQTTNLDNAIKSSEYTITTFIEDPPILLNKSPLEGRYKWLYDAKATVTYKKPDINDYSKTKAVTQYLNLRVQITRVPSASNEHNILIEQWVGSLQAKNDTP